MTEKQGVDVSAIVERFRVVQPDFAERYAVFEERRARFVEEFNVETLRDMELDDYVIGKTGMGLTNTF